MATKIVTKNSSTASAVPTASDLVQGELAVNVADKRLFTEDNAGAIVELGTNPSGNVTFQDNGKATFGAGSDLQVYHDGSNSYIDETATGHLFIRSNGDGIYLRSSTNEEIAHFNVNGSVKAYYDNSLKLATTSTGIDVTGNVTMATGGSIVAGGVNDLILNAGESGTPDIYLQSGSSTKVKIEGSNGNVGIGCTPSRELDIQASSGWAELALRGVSGSSGSLEYYNASTKLAEIYADTSTNIIFRNSTNGTTEAMRIDASGNLLVGKTSAGFANTGHELRGGTYAAFTRDGGSPVLVNRKTSDGTLVEYMKDGSAVGAIGVSGGNNLYISSMQSNHAGLTFATDAILPTRQGTLTDNVTDLGASSERFKDLHLSGTAHTGLNIHLKDSGTTRGKIELNASDTDDLDIKAVSLGSNMKFFTVDTERMRIDSSGNLLVGKTSTSYAVEGIALRADNAGVQSTVTDEAPFTANRLNSDGRLFLFAKDTTTVGGIGTQGGDLYLGTDDANIKFFNSASIQPVNSVGGVRDNAIDLGASSARFKDLYLSANALVGRTSSLSGQSGSVSANTVVSAHGPLSSHATNAGILEYYNDETLLRSYGANAGSGKLVFKVGGGGGSADSEAARIDSAGNLLVGASTFSFAGSEDCVQISGTEGRINIENDTTSTAYAVAFYNTNGLVGRISTSGSATTYSTSSDQRLKENIADADDAGSKIDAIQVRQYDWKADGSHQDYGMIAQELQAVAPEAVSVPEDSEEMMGVDYSKLVPMLIKEIQSLRNRVAQLEE